MELALDLKPKLSTNLALNPSLEQALRLLPLSHAELCAYVASALERNPLLEERGYAPLAFFSKRSVEFKEWARAPTLLEHLLGQLSLCKLPTPEQLILRELISCIDEDGYLPADILETLAVKFSLPESVIAKLLHLLQSCEPLGIGARSLKECLSLQARELASEQDLALSLLLLEEHLEPLANYDLERLAKKLQIPLTALQRVWRLLKRLDPYPGRAYAGLSLKDWSLPPLLPDVYIVEAGEDYVVEVNEAGLPRLQLSRAYTKSLRGLSPVAKHYLRQQLREATTLLSGLKLRKQTLSLVVESILALQKDFFLKGPTHLHPLGLRDIALEVDLHPSTISRVLAHKYVETPQGIWPLKYFLQPTIKTLNGLEDVGAEAVRVQIRKLIAVEDPQRPLADQKIVQLLKAANISIARRTVAKYREMLHIGTAGWRRKQYALGATK